MFDTLGLVGNIIKAGVQYAESGFKNTSEEEYHKRLLVCSTCEEFNNNRCNKCGCYLKLKAKMATEKCPLGKWPNDIIPPSHTKENIFRCETCQGIKE